MTWVKAHTAKEKAHMSAENSKLLVLTKRRASSPRVRRSEMELTLLQNKGAEDALELREKMYACIRHAAEFHCEFEDLVDLEGITEDLKQRPKRQFCFNEGVRFKHVMVKATVEKKEQLYVQSAMRLWSSAWYIPWAEVGARLS